jgi:hypothetical protein
MLGTVLDIGDSLGKKTEIPALMVFNGQIDKNSCLHSGNRTYGNISP